jgi:hypothetical protein
LKTVLQVEFSPSLLFEREAVLKRHGYPVISILGPLTRENVDVSARGMGVVVVGQGAPWLEREGLLAHFRKRLPGIPLVALLRKTDPPFSGADFNCPADNPPLWETVAQALLSTDKFQ